MSVIGKVRTYRLAKNHPLAPTPCANVSFVKLFLARFVLVLAQFVLVEGPNR